VAAPHSCRGAGLYFVATGIQAAQDERLQVLYMALYYTVGYLKVDSFPEADNKVDSFPEADNTLDWTFANDQARFCPSPWRALLRVDLRTRLRV
jgi:hypothetical protein